MQRAGLGDIEWYLKIVKMVLLADDLTENAVIADYNNQTIDVGADLTGASGQGMVKFPKFYYRETEDGSGTLVKTEISPLKSPGFSCHPCFLKADGTERDCIYVGAYEASNSGNNVLQSI